MFRSGSFFFAGFWDCLSRDSGLASALHEASGASRETILDQCPPPPPPNEINTGALIIRIGFWGPLYDNYNKEPPPKIVLVFI